jgi:hypothetical protein
MKSSNKRDAQYGRESTNCTDRKQLGVDAAMVNDDIISPLGRSEFHTARKEANAGREAHTKSNTAGY